MTLNNSRHAIIDNRRRQVATMRLRGMTQREIVAALEKNGVISPETGKPWALGTINSDLAALEAEWKQEAARAIDEHKARQLAELNEVRRLAWAAKDTATVLKVIKQEVDILGTASPEKYTNLNIDISDLTDEQLQRIANGDDPLQVVATTKSAG